MRNQETGTMYLKVLNKKLETDTMVLYYTVIKINISMKLDVESNKIQMTSQNYTPNSTQIE